jgi:hypothetical protein
MTGNYPTTTVLSGDWAQIVIGACGLLMMVLGLVIKYKYDINTIV